MAQFVPETILSGPQNPFESQQYVQIGVNTYLGTKDGIKYAVFSTPENKFKLCEIAEQSSTPENFITTNEAPHNVALNFSTKTHKTLKILAVKKASTPCKGQGDESGNSMLSTPSSASILKSPGVFGKPLYDAPVSGEAKELTYTTLVPRQIKVEFPTNIYAMPQTTSFQQDFTPLSSNPLTGRRPTKVLQKFLPYDSISPVVPVKGKRGRKPKNLWYKYENPPVLHSTPSSFSTSTSSGESIEAGNSSQVSAVLHSFNESPVYPKVPNNTPSSEGDFRSKQSVDMYLLPAIQSRVENLIQMDPRECHNEKERRRRLRIKMACQMIKGFLPRMSDKMDNATVFETAVNFIAFVRGAVGNRYDMDFIEKNCLF